MRVLIVEDNKVFASLMADRMDRSGIESDLVVSVNQAEQAIDLSVLLNPEAA